jgi:hypothetical protein
VWLEQQLCGVQGAVPAHGSGGAGSPQQGQDRRASDQLRSRRRRLGLVYALPEELRAALRLNNKALPGINGDESWELPVPATYVMAQNGRIALAYIEVDYRKHLEPEAILDVLRSLRLS